MEFSSSAAVAAEEKLVPECSTPFVARPSEFMNFTNTIATIG